jgi:hypothetical protein
MATTTITTTIDSTNQQQTKPSESLPAIKQEGPKQLSIAKEMKAAVSKRDSTVVSLGSWYFDKRAKKRKYLSLTGKVYVGAEAMRRCQLDQYNDQHPAIRLRTDLKFGCELAAVDTKLLQLYQEFSVSMSSLQEKHVLTMLSTWGLPEKLVNKYKSHKFVAKWVKNKKEKVSLSALSIPQSTSTNSPTKPNSRKKLPRLSPKLETSSLK